MEAISSNNHNSFLSGGGEMGQLTRQYDWTKTTLGSPDQWPQSLRTTLSILLNSKFPMFLFWGDELLCFYNDAYRPSLGNNGKHPSALGQPGALVWPEIWEQIKPLIDQVLTDGEATWSENQLIPIYRNGQIEDVYWTFSYSPVRNESGQAAGVFVTCTETTQQVNSTKQLQLSEQRFQNLIRQASVGMIVLHGEDMQVTIVNDAYGRLIDRSVNTLLHKPLFTVIPEAEAVFRPIIDQVRLSGEPLYLYEQPYFVYVEGGGTKEGFLNLVYQPFKETDDSITGVVVLCQDVTEQVLVRQKVEESERRFRTLIEDTPVATALFLVPDFRISLANNTMLAYWGKDASILGKPFQEVLPELLGQNIFEPLHEVYNTGRAYEVKEAPALLNRDGVEDTYYFDFSYRPLYQSNGEIYAILNTAVDVTQQVLARQKMEASAAQLRSLVESAPFPIGVYIGKEMTIQLANQSIIDVWDKGQDVIGKRYAEILPELDGQGIYEQLDQVYTTGIPFHANNQRVDIVVDGRLQPYYFKYSFTPLFDAEGKVYGVMNTAAEVTDLILARQELQFSEERYRTLSDELEKLVQQRTEELEATNEELRATNEELTATNEQYMAINEELIESTNLLSRSNGNLEQFAYVASHDLQEPLRKIQQFGDLLKGQYAHQLGEGVNYLERMQSAASRMSTLIKDLLTFSRIATQRETNESVSLQKVVNTVLTDLELTIAETGAEIQIDTLPIIMGDSMQLGQLFQNLLSNALKFRRPDLPPVIHIKADWLAADHLPINVRPGRRAIAYHHIQVIDNGIGFDEKYLDRMFEVFQRLHNRSEYAGTGIGLAICQKVVVNHGGALTASSQPGQGATFSVYLPV